MVERQRGWTIATHTVLGLGLLVVAFPLYVALVASTHTAQELMGQVPLWFGSHLVDNSGRALTAGGRGAGSAPVLRMLVNSLVMALTIAVGKIAISIISAYAIVYFRFPFRMACFWTVIFPLLAPTSFFLLVVNLVYAFFDTFGIIHAVTGGGPAKATETLVYKVFNDGFIGLDFGGSAAQSVILMAIVIALTVIQFRYIERRVVY